MIPDGTLAVVVEKVTIPWSGGEVSGRVSGSGPVGILLAHGAGVDQDHPLMRGLGDGLAREHRVVTFNYPYAVRGAKRPDRTPTLVECHRGAAEYLRPQVDLLILAGRSMGGRMATYLVVEGYAADGLVLYAYPLHPPGRHEKLRIDQFPGITIPMLFFQGTRDSLSEMGLFEKHIASLPNAEVEILEGAGHGPRGGGWTAETMIDRYVTVTSSWIKRISSGESSGQRP